MTINIITHSVTLSADGYDDLSLDCSSFSWTATAENGVDGSLVIQGLDDASDIADMVDAGATIAIVKTKNGADETLIEDMEVDDLSIFKGPINRSISLGFSGDNPTATSTTIEVDDLSSYDNYQNGWWSFRLNEMFSDYAPGMLVEYQGVERNIASVSVNWSASGGTVTLTEGNESGATTTGCEFSIESGVTVTESFASPGTNCFAFPWKLDGRSIDAYYYIGGYYCWLAYTRQYSFELLAEASVSVVMTNDIGEITTGLANPSLGIYYPPTGGCKMEIVSGEIAPWTPAGASIISTTLGPTWTVSGTLPAGIYTIRIMAFYAGAVSGVNYEIDLTVT